MIGFERTILSQYGTSSTIGQLCRNIDEYLDPRADFDTFYNFVWNVDTAEGFGLDTWGRIVNVGRTLNVPAGTPNPGYFPFTPGSFELDDDQYRVVILTKALANITNCTAESLNQLLTNLFADRGRCYVRDTGSMTMMWTFEFFLEPYEYIIMSEGGVAPIPAGVLAKIRQIDAEGTFGFDEAVQMQPFDQGVFYNPNPFPSASNVQFTGSLVFGGIQTLTYDFYDPEGRPESGSTYRWQRSDDGVGMGTKIAGATATTYQIGIDDSDKYLRAGVRPSNGIEFGIPAYSVYKYVPFFPAGLFSGGYAGGCYDPAYPGTMFQTFDGFTPSDEPSEPIGRINPIAGSIVLTQPTAGSRLTYASIPWGGRMNLLTDSERFGIPSWQKVRASFSSGELKADATADSSHYMFQNTRVVSGTQYAWYADVEQSHFKWAAIQFFSTNSAFANTIAYYDLVNGVVGVAGNPATAQIENRGNGVYRISLSATATASAAGNIGVYIAEGDGDTTLAGTVTGLGIKVYRAQLEVGTTPTPYQAVTGPWDVTETGKPQVIIPYLGGGDWMDTGVTNFGTATQGYFADTGENWELTVVWAGFGSGSLMAQTEEALEADRMFDFLQNTDGAVDINVRGTVTQVATGCNDGSFHIAQIRCLNGVLTVKVDNGSVVTPTVGGAVAEAVEITYGCRNASSPANICTDLYVMPPMIIDKALSDTDQAQEFSYWNNTVGINQ